MEVTHTYEEEFAEASGCCGGSGCCGDTATTAATTAAAEVPLASAFIRGRKPAEENIVSTKELGVVEENSASKGGAEEGVERLVALGRALSDPIRVRMLSMMAEGRSCCDFSDSGVPAGEGEEGICVCEFEEVFGMGQSKVSYHMKKLKDARAGARGAAREVGLLLARQGGRRGAARRGRRSPALRPREAEGAMAAAEATGDAASPRIGPAVLDALVVGAGQAGLAAGYHLKRAGLSFEILEARREPGGSWPGYYDSLKLFSPARYSACRACHSRAPPTATRPATRS